MGDAWMGYAAGLAAGLVLAWCCARRPRLVAALRERLRRSRRGPRFALELPVGGSLRLVAQPAYGQGAGSGYLVPMGKERHPMELALPPDSELQVLLGGRRLTSEMQRAYEDYLRLRSALGWLMDLEPDNEVAIAMVRGDTARAEMRLMRMLRESVQT